MKPFCTHSGIAVPLDRADVDTDQIIPKQFLKRVERSGFGQFLFHDWRFRPDGSEEPCFELNQPRYRRASILLAGRNFGCGSSREHAPWALADYGFRAIIAPSFADIFASNCAQNGLVAASPEEAAVRELMRRAASIAGYSLTVDLENCVIRDAQGFSASFAIDEFRRRRLLNGWDDIGLTLRHQDAIAAYESLHPMRQR